LAEGSSLWAKFFFPENCKEDVRGEKENGDLLLRRWEGSKGGLVRKTFNISFRRKRELVGFTEVENLDWWLKPAVMNSNMKGSSVTWSLSGRRGKNSS